ncbi:unnamed protein product [Aspergillus oryzae]|nr:unnamed protein product [Aspergillus oryzae]
MRLDIHKSFRLSILPVPTLHQVLKRKDPAVFLNVPRFMNWKDELCIRVSEGLCSGYWICQGPPEKPLRPKDSDVVLLWFHGGAYYLGGPLGEAVALLRTAECAASIFSVDYTLAPFATYPRQQEEAVAAYRHLLFNEGIEASRQAWKQVLPAHSWISISGHDIFLDDTHNLVHQARLDGALVDLEITDGEPHGWQFAANKASEMIYSNLPPNKEVPERVMPGRLSFKITAVELPYHQSTKIPQVPESLPFEVESRDNLPCNSSFPPKHPPTGENVQKLAKDSLLGILQSSYAVCRPGQIDKALWGP